MSNRTIKKPKDTKRFNVIVVRDVKSISKQSIEAENKKDAIQIAHQMADDKEFDKLMWLKDNKTIIHVIHCEQA